MGFFGDMIDFTGKTVVVTGGVGLIGHQVARAFLEFNASVVVADIDRGRFEQMFAGTAASFEQFDITDPAVVRPFLEKMRRERQSVHVWINCAYPRTKDWGNFIDDVTFESWDANVRMHLGGYFWTSKNVLELMKEKRAGCVINFGSTYGMLAPNFNIYAGTGVTNPVAYSAIKGGIINLSRYLAALYGPYNVRVNCVCPSGVFNGHNDTFVSRFSDLTPLRRMAHDYELAMPVVFLASEAASYITGHALMVDGGWTAW